MTTGLLTTTAGRSAIIADLGGGADLVLTHVAWGDANGVPYNPNEAQVALVNEKYRATIASVAVVGGAIVVDAVIPADTNDGTGRPSHGFNVAEVGLFNSTGTLIGLARCGNGYKPPPSSGQAHDVTYRLKLAVANPSAITVVVDPQAQIAVGRLVRPGWITVDGVLNDPPAGPAMGATYIVGAAPTGAWVGFAHRIAQWIGVWSLASVPVGHHAVDNSKGIDAGSRWLERTAGGWAPGVSRLIQRQPGNYAVAGGTGDAITAVFDPPLTAYEAGQVVRVKLSATNTTNVPTFKANALAAIPIKRWDGGPVEPGHLSTGAEVQMQFDAAGNARLMTVHCLQRRRAIFFANGTHTVPAGVFRHFRKAKGGGGGGGGSLGSLGAAVGGGGGGHAEGWVDVTPGDVINVIVGAGGPGGTSGANGAPGGLSSCGSISATGGGGGAGANGSTTNGGSPGGGGFGGDLNISGYGGGSGLAFVAGALTVIIGGPGGGAFGVPGSPPSVSAQSWPSPAADGFYPSGGGVGGAGNQAGGKGGDGQVIIEW